MEDSIMKAVETAHTGEKLTTIAVGERMVTQAEQSSQSAMTSLFQISLNTESYGLFQFQAVLAHQVELFDQTSGKREVSMPIARVAGVVRDIITQILRKTQMANYESLSEIESDVSLDAVFEDIKDELHAAVDTGVVVRMQAIRTLFDCRQISHSCDEATRIKFSQAIAKRLIDAPPLQAADHDINEAIVTAPVPTEDEDRIKDEAVYETFRAEYQG